MYKGVYVRMYVHMCVCIYVSKSNEGSQLIYIQPWAQGCRQGGWPLRGVRGCGCVMYIHMYVCTYECAEVRNGLLELRPIYNL